MSVDKTIQKRVSITTFPENIFNCALPNRKGFTIPTIHTVSYSPHEISSYKNDLCKKISNLYE